MLVPADKEHCKSCKYSTSFYGGGRKKKVKKGYCCDYIGIMSRNGDVKSRIFKDGVKQYDASMCDKYEKGKRKRSQTWDETNSKIFFNREEEY